MAHSLTRPQFISLTALGGVSVLLVAANSVLFAANRTVQQEVAERAAMVQQTVPLEALQRDIARNLAGLALRDGDQQMLEMLAANGVTVKPNASAAPAAPAAPSAPTSPVRP